MANPAESIDTSDRVFPSCLLQFGYPGLVKGNIIDTHVQLDFLRSTGRASAQCISEQHVLSWPVFDSEIVPLELKQHTLKPWWGTCKALLMYHLQGLVVTLNCELPPKHVGVEVLAGKYNGKEFSFNVGIPGLSVS